MMIESRINWVSVYREKSPGKKQIALGTTEHDNIFKSISDKQVTFMCDLPDGKDIRVRINVKNGTVTLLDIPETIEKNLLFPVVP